VKFLLENYEVDVLAKNKLGKSALTEAFQAGNSDILELFLAHSSASEERLIDLSDNEGSKVNLNISSEAPNANKESESDSVTHELNFRKKSPSAERSISVSIRELPVVRDGVSNPLGTSTSPESDATGNIRR